MGELECRSEERGVQDLETGDRGPVHSVIDGFEYRQYRDERDLPLVMHLVDNELSEPYSIFTYRYFLNNWPSLCFLVYDKERCFGTVVCKLDAHKDRSRGYLAMLVVEKDYRSKGVGSHLVKQAIQEMIKKGADEVTLEAEVTNRGALKLYENLGFIRDKRLHKYYLNGTDAFRLKLLLPFQVCESAIVPGLDDINADQNGGDQELAVVGTSLGPVTEE